MTAKVLLPTAPSAEPTPALKRRGLLIGAGAAGAAVLAAGTLPGAADQVAEVVAKAAPDTAAGYRLSAHVLRYYETTKV